MPGVINLAGPAQTAQKSLAGTDAFGGILQTLGEIETIRQNRMMESSVLSALSRGASPEELMKIVNQPVQFDEGVPGFFQRIAARYAQPSPLKEAVTQAGAKEAISPDKVTMSDIRMREYLKAVQAGDTERADKLLMSSLVTIETGQKLLTPEKRQALADKEFSEKMALTPTQQNNARKSAKTIVQEMGTRIWKWGTKNYARGNLIQGYKQYRTENDYESKSTEHRKWLDDNWDSQMITYNKSGYKDIGKNEFDWDPEDEKVTGLRKETGVPTPKNKTEFSNTLRRLQLEDYDKAKEYYDKYLDKFY